ncbi:MAG: hypothetical protein Q9M35_01560 [Rhodothermus sp.]|nr:hypothetical protein [Rhodothermus sp.]
MNQLELGEKILRYPWLSEEEQRQVRAAVHRVPEWKEVLDSVQQLTPLLQSLHLTAEGSMSEEKLAFYLLTRYLSPHPLPPSLAAYFAQLEARLETDAALRRRCEALARRLEELLEGVDAVEHFEQLTGRTIQKEATELVVCESPAGAHTNLPSKVVSRAPDRPAQRTTRRSSWRWVERVALLVVALSVVYGGLFFWSRATQSELERLGFIAPALLTIDRYRGEAPAAETAEALYQEALRTIATAHSSWFGLFPRYDADLLARAESLLVAATRAPAAALPQQEALFLLGKVRLLRHDIAGARQVLQEVATQEGPYTEEAQRLLRALQCLETSATC